MVTKNEEGAVQDSWRQEREVLEIIIDMGACMLYIVPRSRAAFSK